MDWNEYNHHLAVVEAHSPGLNNREWIETEKATRQWPTLTHSPGLNNREWIETANNNKAGELTAILPV